MFYSFLFFTMRDVNHGYGSSEKIMLLMRLTLITALLTMLIFLFPLILFKWKPHGKNFKQTPAALPPGPTPWPIVGNLPELWRNKPAFRWIHGLLESLNTEIACIRLGGVHVIPVTSPELAREFLKKHDIVFASRPLFMSNKYASRGFKSTALVPWGDQWKKMKKLVASEIINSKTTRWLLNKRTEEADNLVRFIYNQCKNAAIDSRPDDQSISGSVVDVRLVARHYCGNVIRKMIFNRRYFGKGKKDGGPGVEEEEHIESLFTILVHLNAFALSDYLPCLTALDLDGHGKIVSEAMKIVTSYEDPVVHERLRQWRDGEKTEAEDLLDAFILAKDSNGKAAFSVEEIKAQITELMLATVDNPSNCIEWTLAEMLNQPELLQKAVEEIDRVVGKKRWVQESDIPQLNYVKACAREGFRLHPIAPFNVPHVSMQDATVAGYFIPKGSHVILSRYGLGRNPRVWKEPLRFKPDRHLKKKEDGSSMADDQEVELAEHELRFISFSTGRRGCMGIALGSAMTVMLLARLLQGFSWSLPPNQEEIDLSETMNELIMAKPLRAHANPRLAASLYPA